MKLFERILCPVDFSAGNNAAIELATSLAKQHGSELIFVYVAMLFQPEASIYALDSFQDMINEQREQFRKIRPSDSSVSHDHIFVQGNPGPEIVKVAESCDLVVMNTHGHSGILRLLVGSVAEYVIRHAPCPVLALKNQKPKPSKPKPSKPKPGKADKSTQSDSQYVTQVMRHVRPVHGYDNIENVLEELVRENQSGTPVVSDEGHCVGILTRSDIDKYRGLKQRLEDHDESVLDEVFETDKYGLRRADNIDFDQVHRHMTKPVVTVSNDLSCADTGGVFRDNPTIHHLVVVDNASHPIGIVEPQDVALQQSGKVVEKVE